MYGGRVGTETNYCSTLTEVKQIGIFVDLPNILTSSVDRGVFFSFKRISDFGRSIGTIYTARAYGILRPGGTIPMAVIGAAREGFEFIPSIQDRDCEKDIDTRMVADLVDSLRGNMIDTYIVVSGDSDFLPAMRVIREKGKNSIVIGTRGTIGRSMDRVATSVVYLEDIMKKATVGPKMTNEKLPGVIDKTNERSEYPISEGSRMSELLSSHGLMC